MFLYNLIVTYNMLYLKDTNTVTLALKNRLNKLHLFNIFLTFYFFQLIRNAIRGELRQEDEGPPDKLTKVSTV